MTSRSPWAPSLRWSESRRSGGPRPRWATGTTGATSSRPPNEPSPRQAGSAALFRAVQRAVGRLHHLIPLRVALVLLRRPDADRHGDALPRAPVGQHFLLLLLGAEPGP